MSLDFRTLYEVGAVSLLASAVLSALLARSYAAPQSTAGLHWAVAGLVSSLAFAFLAVRGLVPEAVSVLGAHSTGIGSACIYHHACLRLVGRRKRVAAVYWPVVAGTISAAYFLFHSPNLSIRVGIFSALTALPLASGAITLSTWRDASNRRMSAFGAIGLAVASAVLALRSILRYATDPALSEQANFATSWSEQVSILIVLIVYSLLPWLFVVISNDKLTRDLERLATLDALTEVLNRRAIEEALQRERSSARRFGRCLSVVVADVDYLKEINDRYGHGAGDEAIRHVVGCLRSTVRSSDVVGRWGGDEFLILLPNTNSEQAGVFGDRLCRLVRSSPPPWRSSGLPLTLTVGAATEDGAQPTGEDAVVRADRALLEAKRQGRDRCIVVPGGAGA